MSSITTTITKNPKQKPPLDKLGFARHFSDHMFTMDYSRESGWHNAAIGPFADFTLHPASMTLHYGQAIFEGLKAYHSQDGRALLFRPEKNMERLNM